MEDGEKFYYGLIEGTSADDHLLAWFAYYEDRKDKKTLYDKDDYLPGALITMYFQSKTKATFNEIYNNFKNQYILNESDLENVHTQEERDGLGAVYDFILNENVYSFNSVFFIMVIHNKLYSKGNYPKFGGMFRKSSALITFSKVPTAEPHEISNEIASLNEEYLSIIDQSKEINQNNKTFDIINYINRCIKLNIALLRIHPFPDGNGRTCRAFLNVMFKMINLPPVYVKSVEKGKYLDAVNSAINDGDYTEINKFYHYKICDSILELDINYRLNKERKRLK